MSSHTGRRRHHCNDLPLAHRWCVRLAIVITLAGGLIDIYMRGHI